MDSRHLPYAALPAPRYTSYPAATHFDAGTSPEEHARWLANLAPASPVSLYVHVPYCRDICHYCACHTFAVRRDETLQAYVRTLLREIALTGGASSAKTVNEIHWGGGTPNLLSPESFERIVAEIRTHFDIGQVREHAIEIDPRVLTAAHAQAYVSVGVDRASLGVQDLNDHVQQAIGRMQPFDMVRDAVQTLRGAGLNNINFDLMYGLPSQSVDDLRASIRLALTLQPNRLAMFGYAHVPWFKTRQKLIDAATLPDSETRFAQAEAAREELLNAGYQPIGFDHFARADDSLAKAALTGGLRRNFQGYVDDECAALIGIGASAISSLPQGYSQNAPEVGAWTRAIESGRFATVRGRALSEDDRMRRAMIEDLLCRFSLDLSAYGGAERFTRELVVLEPLARDGLVQIEAGRIIIPFEAQQLARLVAKVFDAYEADVGRHSSSV